ncbi:MAG: hypothetical protein QOG43_2740 [Actinomycetota bacterium]|nr:hypothetical protein [Actinomycetota bacterium]
MGLVAGLNPFLGVAAALGVAFLLIVLADLTLGVVAFVLLSFLDVVHFRGGSLTFTKLAGLALCVSWLATIGTQDRRAGTDFFARHPGYAASLGLFVGWVALSALWAEDAGPVFNAVQRYGLNMLLLPIVYTAVRRRRHVTWILAAFVIGALVSMLYGLAVPAPPVPGDVSRLGGAIGEANETATVLVAAIVLSIGLVGAARRSPLLAAGALAGVPLALAGLVDTLSRAGIVSLGFSLVAACVLGGRWRRYVIVLTVVAVVGGIGYFLSLPPASRDRVVSANTTGRTDLWNVAWRAVEDHPWRGIGADNFPISSAHYLVRPGATTRADFIVTTPKVVHNVYLEQLTSLGVVGLVLFLAIPAASLSCCVKAARRFQKRGDQVLELTARAVMVALVGILAADFFASEQYSKQLWLLLALGPALLALAENPVPE